MDKSRAFEIAVVLLLIICTGLLYYAIEVSQPASESWEIQANGSIDYMLLGTNETLYVFQGNNISAILADGTLKWTHTVPGNYHLINRWAYPEYTLMNGVSVHDNRPYPVAEENNGSLYVYAFHSLNASEVNELSEGGSINHTSVIIALSPEGTTGWEYPVTSHITANGYDSGSTSYPVLPGLITIDSSGGRLLVYHDHVEEVLADDGTLLYTISGLAGPASFDETGRLFGVKTVQSYDHLSDIEANGTVARVWNAFEVSASGAVSPGGYNADPNATVEIATADGPGNVYDRLTSIASGYSGRMVVYHDGAVEDWNNRTLLGIYRYDSPQIIAYETGEIYSVKAVASFDDHMTIYREATPLKGSREASAVPSGTVEAFSPEGCLIWSADLGEPVEQQSAVESVWKQYDSLPLYRNGTLYAFVRDGVAALDTAGNIKWIRHLVGGSYVPFSLMPIDSAGNVYLQLLTDRLPAQYVTSISARGQVYPEAWIYKTSYAVYGRDGQVSNGLSSIDDLEPEPYPVAGGDGIIYAIGVDLALDNASFASLLNQQHIPSDTLTAYDIRTGQAVWNFTIPAEDRSVFTLGPETLNLTQRSYTYEGVHMMNLDPETGQRASMSGWSLAEKHQIEVCHSANITYIYYDYLVYDMGISYVYHMPNATGNIASQAKGLYAVDNQGRLIWKKPVRGSIDRLVANNSTLYYSTSDGRLGGISANLAAGIALAALLYLILRFFVVGSVARARNRIDKNENRNTVLRYIADNPGATLADVVRCLGINQGTARYHLLVLSLNHRIMAHEDSKFVRYFPKTSTFDDQERSLLSVARRKPMARILGILSEKPGLSNRELSRELNLSAAATHEQVTELLDRGVLIRKLESDGEYAYSIKDEHLETIILAIGRT